MNKSGGILAKPLVQLLLVVVALGTGALIFMFLASKKKPLVKKERPVVTPLVEGITVHPEDLQMIVYGFGTAEPKVSVQVVPQVSGQVVNCHANFVEGGFFKAGEPLVKVDPRDYELEVETPKPQLPRRISFSSRSSPKLSSPGPSGKLSIPMRSRRPRWCCEYLRSKMPRPSFSRRRRSCPGPNSIWNERLSQCHSTVELPPRMSISVSI